MTAKKKRRIISTAVTATVHLALLILLAFITLKVSENDELEDGVPVMLGSVDDAAGEDLGGLPDMSEASSTEETVAEEVESTPEEPVAEQPEATEKPAMTQEQERSIAAEEAKRKKEEELRKKAAEEEARKQAEAKRKAAEEEARKKAAEEEAKRKLEERRKSASETATKAMSAFGNNKGTGSGYTTGNGNQGSPTGNSNTGATKGTGGTGNGISASTTRNMMYSPKLQISSEESGVTVIEVSIDSNGKVTPKRIKSNTAGSQLGQYAWSVVSQIKFSSGKDGETADITFRFRPPAK